MQLDDIEVIPIAAIWEQTTINGRVGRKERAVLRITEKTALSRLSPK